MHVYYSICIVRCLNPTKKLLNSILWILPKYLFRNDEALKIGPILNFLKLIHITVLGLITNDALQMTSKFINNRYQPDQELFPERSQFQILFASFQYLR